MSTIRGKCTSPAGSATEEAQELLGDSVKVVAAFQNVSAHELRHLAHTIDCDVLVCGNDRGARQTVMQLVEHMGLRAVDAGLAYNARVIESLTALLIGLNIDTKSKAVAFALLASRHNRRLRSPPWFCGDQALMVSASSGLETKYPWPYSHPRVRKYRSCSADRRLPRPRRAPIDAPV